MLELPNHFLGKCVASILERFGKCHEKIMEQHGNMAQETQYIFFVPTNVL